MRLATPLCALGAVLSLAAGAHAQKVIPSPPPTAATLAGCDIGEAETVLDVGEVRARLFNMGGLFWRGTGPLYEVPAPQDGTSDGVNALFTAGLWIAGHYDGDRADLRFAGSTYGPWEYWPGPLDEAGVTAPERCAAFDRIWAVTADDLAAYSANGETAATNPDLLSWPIAQGAPYYFDANGNDRRDPAEPRLALLPGDDEYSAEPGEGAALDLAAGYRPDLVGDAAAWWVMNDAGGSHDWSELPALGVEVRVLAYGYDAPTSAASGGALTRATVYEYTVLNRNDAPITDARLGFWVDIDLGDFNDDYVASDSTRGLLIGYNGDEFDDTRGVFGYGEDPPAIGIDFLSGAGGAMQFYGGGTVISDPVNGEEAYLFLQNRWKDGSYLREGYNGFDTNGEITSWTFSGDPTQFGYWTEENVDGEGTRNTPSDRRALISTDELTLAPGEPVQFDVAILFADAGPAGTRLASVQRLRDISDAVQERYDAVGTVGIRDAEVAYTPPPPPLATAPALLAPADGADFDTDPPDSITFEWAPVEGATAYLLDFEGSDRADVITAKTSATVSLRDLPEGASEPTWSVATYSWGGPGSRSETRQLSLYNYLPAVLTLADGTPAFVEVVGPGGVNPCGAQAASTDGCDEVGGNLIYGSPNSTGDYVGVSSGAGPEEEIGAFAPNDYEIRFTEAGSYGFYGFTTGRIIEVPFEVWDIGPVPPGTENDPADDVQLVPVLFADAGDDAAAECAFAFNGDTTFGLGGITQRIYAYYATGDDYAAYAAAAAADVGAAEGGCAEYDPDVEALIDFGRGRPLQRFVLENAGGLDGPADLLGTVIRFYTTDPRDVPAEGGPDGPALSLAAYPNPVRGTAEVPFALAAPADVRLRVVDVLGREVAVLAEGPRAAGPHRAAFDASSVAAGVYVVVLEGGGRRVARTLTVVR